MVTATGALLEQVLDDTYPIWNEGLSREAYGRWNQAQATTPWGRGHLRRVALAEGGRVLSSAKHYEFEARVAGRDVPVLGIGAVFTSAEARRQGHARALINEMTAEAASAGAGLALLFSEIGASYYEAMGFQTVPRPSYVIDVIRGRGGAPATLVRSGEAADFDLMAEISARYAEGAGFALVRTPDLIQFGLARRRLLAGLGPPGLRDVEFFVAEEANRAVAYVIVTRGLGGRVLEDCGDRDPAGARVGAILQVLAAREPAEPVMRLRGWLPPSFRPPQIRMVQEEQAGEIMMVKSIGKASPAFDGHAAVYWNLDVF